MSIIGLNHVGLSCPDLEAQRAFWHAGLGLPEVAAFSWEPGNDAADAGLGLAGSAADVAIWHLGNVYLEVFRFRAPEPRPSQGTGWAALTVIVSDVDDFRGAALRAGGLEDGPVAVRDPGGTRVLPVVAPAAVSDGSRLILGLHSVTLDAADPGAVGAWWSTVPEVAVAAYEGRDSDQPRDARVARRICDLGVNHVCLDVTDIEATHAALSAAGMTSHVTPQRMPAGLAAVGYAWDPWGNALELLESFDERATLSRHRLSRVW